MIYTVSIALLLASIVAYYISKRLSVSPAVQINKEGIIISSLTDEPRKFIWSEIKSCRFVMDTGIVVNGGGNPFDSGFYNTYDISTGVYKIQPRGFGNPNLRLEFSDDTICIVGIQDLDKAWGQLNAYAPQLAPRKELFEN